jgi:uncharacterized protein YndB with AHSA1/START domain
MQKEIRHVWQFRHPPEIVWEYLTNSDLIALWLMPNDFKPIAGHHFMFKVPPVPALDFDGLVYCRVLEIKPPERLSYSWKYGPGKGKTRVDSIVIWTLRPTENGTELRLNHNGFDESINQMDFQAMFSGWKTNVDKIEKLLSTRYPNETTND